MHVAQIRDVFKREMIDSCYLVHTDRGSNTWSTAIEPLQYQCESFIKDIPSHIDKKCWHCRINTIYAHCRKISNIFGWAEV